jgi:exonuclease SbcC
VGDAEPAQGGTAEPTFSARQDGLSERLAQATSARRTSRVVMFVFLLSAFAVWGVTGLLGLAPASPQAEALAGWLTRIDADFKDLFLPWLPVIASVLTLLSLGFMGRLVGLSAQIEGLERSRVKLIDEETAARQETTALAGLDDMPLAAAAEMLEQLRDQAIADRVPEFREGPGAALLNPERHAAGQQEFRRILQTLEAGVSQVKADTGREIERRHASIANHSSAVARLDEVISHERERVRRHRELTSMSQSLTDKIDGLGRQTRVRTLAIDLLHGAIHYISQRFNTEVRNLSADSLPKFTNGRYEHLQIDENLKVKAFSNEKRDFMDLDEISSGTQRQIMLAVRLSLSQKLVNSVIQGPQMLFLDEPFAFFDERRTASALSVLPQVSGDFTQIWVTSQTFPAESHFDLYVECNAEETRSPVVRRGTER